MSLMPFFRGEGLGKTYTTPVLSEVSLDLNEGEVLALAGENGAGKSTLTKLIAGLLRPSEGQMQLRGKPYSPASRREAEKQGVRMVLQELGLIPTLTVAENLLLGHIPNLVGFVRRQEMNELAASQMAIIGLESIDPRTLVGHLGVGHQQMVEIARNLVGDCQLLILDEPTAMLTSREIDHLFRQITALQHRRVGVIYISHRLDELQQVADRVMVLRDGRHIDTRSMRQVVQNDIVRMMVGHAVSEDRNRTDRAAGKVALEVRGLGRGSVVQEVSLALHEGEILGRADGVTAAHLWRGSQRLRRHLPRWSAITCAHLFADVRRSAGHRVGDGGSKDARSATSPGYPHQRHTGERQEDRPERLAAAFRGADPSEPASCFARC